MFVRVKSTPNSPRRSVQLVESRRTGQKVNQVIVRHVGVALDDAEEKELRHLAELMVVQLEQEANQNFPLFAPEEVASAGLRPRKIGLRKAKQPQTIDKVRLADVVEEQRVIEGIGDIFGPLFKALGFDAILPSASETLEATVLARIANPVSKRRTAARLEEDFGVRQPVDRIYRMMDVLYENKERMQDIVRQATLSLFPGKIEVVFFDVTTLYFESIQQDGLRDFGYSKDSKFHSVQVMLALATTERGLPIGYRLFQGSTAEPRTLIEALDSWRKLVDIGRVVLVADRAMMSDANLRALEEAGLEYVVGASLKKQPKELKAKILDASGFRPGHIDSDFVWVNEFELDQQKGRRLIAAFSSKRARKDISDRNRLVENLQKRLGKKPKASLKKLVSNRGYIKVISTEGQATATIDDAKLAADAAWDGMYGVVTNSTDDKLSLLARYRRLWTIEEAFRVTKHDLAMRPVFHFKPERIEAHVAICYLAYTLIKHSQHHIRLRQHAMSAANSESAFGLGFGGQQRVHANPSQLKGVR